MDVSSRSALALSLVAVLCAVLVSRRGRNATPMPAAKVEYLSLLPEDQGKFDAVRDVILPRFWTGEDALDARQFQIDCSDYNMSDPAVRSPDGPLAQRMKAVYAASGVVHLVNTGLGSDLTSMREFALFVLGGEMKYDGGANNRDPIVKNVYDVGAPLVAHLHYHHEMTYVRQSTQALAFMCAEELPDRGATFISESVGVTEEILKTELGRKLADKGVCFLRDLTDRDAPSSRPHESGRPPLGVYNHWQHSFETDNPAVAEKLAKERGLKVEWDTSDPERGRVMKTRYYADAFEYFPPLDRNILFASLADHGMWFDSWPYIQHLPYRKRPLHMTFGDDEDFTDEERKLFVEVYDHHGIKIDWKQGEVAVICNYRFAHGRPGIHLQNGERRRLGVLLGPTFRRVGQRQGKWGGRAVA